jgi:hypothetical protein
LRQAADVELHTICRVCVCVCVCVCVRARVRVRVRVRAWVWRVYDTRTPAEERKMRKKERKGKGKSHLLHCMAGLPRHRACRALARMPAALQPPQPPSSPLAARG